MKVAHSWHCRKRSTPSAPLVQKKRLSGPSWGNMRGTVKESIPPDRERVDSDDIAAVEFGRLVGIQSEIGQARDHLFVDDL